MLLNLFSDDTCYSKNIGRFLLRNEVRLSPNGCFTKIDSGSRTTSRSRYDAHSTSSMLYLLEFKMKWGKLISVVF